MRAVHSAGPHKAAAGSPQCSGAGPAPGWPPRGRVSFSPARTGQQQVLPAQRYSSGPTLQLPLRIGSPEGGATVPSPQSHPVSSARSPGGGPLPSRAPLPILLSLLVVRLSPPRCSLVLCGWTLSPSRRALSPPGPLDPNSAQLILNFCFPASAISPPCPLPPWYVWAPADTPQSPGLPDFLVPAWLSHHPKHGPGCRLASV